MKSHKASLQEACLSRRKIKEGKERNWNRGNEREKTMKGRQKFLFLQRKKNRKNEGWYEE